MSSIFCMSSPGTASPTARSNELGHPAGVLGALVRNSSSARSRSGSAGRRRAPSCSAVSESAPTNVHPAEVHLHLARPHVVADDRRERPRRPLGAERALRIGELHERHRRRRRAERRAVLRHPVDTERRDPVGSGDGRGRRLRAARRERERGREAPPSASAARHESQRASSDSRSKFGAVLPRGIGASPQSLRAAERTD